MSDNGKNEALWETARKNMLFVLVKPVYGGNIGSVARSLSNMGFRRLVLVDPCDFRGDEARMMASGHTRILQNAEVHETLDQALATVGLAIGTSRRVGRQRPLTDTPDTAARTAAENLGRGEVALVFGNEVSGLSNEELDRCQRGACIPTAGDAPSMNLSHAVTVFAYELRKYLLGESLNRFSVPERPFIPRGEMEILYHYWEDLVRALDLEKCTSVKVTMRRLRNIFDRVGLDMRELGMIRKIVKWAAGRLRNENG